MATAIETAVPALEGASPEHRWDTLARALAIVSHAMSKDETRYNLTGVFLELDGPQAIRLTATDGHRLTQVAIRLSLPLPARGFILAAADVKRLLAEAKRAEKAAGRHLKATFECVPDNGGLAFRTTWPVDSSLIVCRPVDGEFPNYRQVVPAAPDHYVSAFNSRYVAEACKALGSLNERSGAVKLLASADPCVPIRLEATDADGTEVFSILMPMRL